ncbi:hypothetical protein [Kitasatospora sp. NPDC050543]|uniref:hypothetical protein n=1 Tax=Kitasatospora sp. NPDC050543 TaxID=3364054 RepID=UPI0037B55BA2
MREPADGGGGYQVSPGELEGCGHSAKEVAGQIPGETGKVVGPSDSASGAFQGWQLSGALHDCTADWKTLLDKLSADMDSYGAKLIQMAQEYRGSDHTAMASMNAIGAKYAAPAPAAAAGTDPFGTRVHGRRVREVV